MTHITRRHAHHAHHAGLAKARHYRNLRRSCPASTSTRVWLTPVTTEICVGRVRLQRHAGLANASRYRNLRRLCPASTARGFGQRQPLPKSASLVSGFSVTRVWLTPATTEICVGRVRLQRHAGLANASHY